MNKADWVFEMQRQVVLDPFAPLNYKIQQVHVFTVKAEHIRRPKTPCLYTHA